MTNRLKIFEGSVRSNLPITNRRDLLVVEWTNSGFSSELVAICSNTPFIRNLEGVIVDKQESFGKELDETV